MRLSQNNTRHDHDALWCQTIYRSTKIDRYVHAYHTD